MTKKLWVGIFSVCLLLGVKAKADDYLLAGKVGEYPIVMTISVRNSNENGSEYDNVVGQYFYVNRLIPINLIGESLQQLNEEVPVENSAPSFEFKKTGVFSGQMTDNRYQGQWQNASATKSLPFELTVIKQGDGAEIDAAFRDQMRSAIAFEKIGTEPIFGTNLNKVIFVEPNTRVQQSRVAGLDNPEAQEKINQFLAEKHQDDVITTAECLSYWSTDELGTDDDWVRPVDWQLPHHTDTLIEINYKGTVFCGGAHPSHYYKIFHFDTVTGQGVDLTSLFDIFSLENATSWDESTIDPDFWALLLKYAEKKSQQASQQSEFKNCFPSSKDEDDIDLQYLQNYLSLRLAAREDYIAVKYQGLPYVSFLCETENLAEIPLVEMAPFATEQAKAYFPQLK